MILALYSYSLAYEYASKGLELGEDIDQNLNAVLSICALELVVLLRKNSVDENSLFFCNNFMVSLFNSFLGYFRYIFLFWKSFWNFMLWFLDSKQHKLKYKQSFPMKVI